MSCLPAAANSGQYRATGASRSSSPRWTRRLAQIAVAPFVLEATTMMLSLGPRPTGLLVGHPAPEIHDLLATVIRAAGRADFAVVLEVRRKGVPDALEARGHFTVYLTHVHLFPDEVGGAA